eukprot:gnl/TRDRNA2_/TRDRNA2_189646_c0_seq1.p2 gnl/TRDRNA2_/TRDRNA2_189646_c0~~gnl/TRDRNA2_/TRDRNA2_189646_c0_seq1.p2  ORF type:complete len:270 (+),score=63.00 gnl/TRDRNA2_/TRDRNA2_189646_c0_seq1:57-866(+)
MSVQEFSGIFRHEIDRYLSKLERGSFSASRTSSGPDCSPGSVGTSQHVDPERIELLRRLAGEMSCRILQRVNDHASHWGLDPQSFDELTADVKHGKAHPADRTAGADAWTDARLLQLEQVLAKKKEEEAEVRREKISRLRSEYQSVLHVREQELQKLREAVSNGADETGDALTAVRIQDLHQQVSKNVEHIHSQLTAAKELVMKLDHKLKDVDKIEAHQRRGRGGAESLLTSNEGCDDMDEEDRRMSEAIERGEQVCKRMRRHLVESVA